MSQIIDDYLANLRPQLTNLTEAEQHATINFYHNFLLDGDFQTKEEIIKELGSPHILAQKITQDYAQSVAASIASTASSNSSSNYLHGFHVEKIPLRTRTISAGSFTQINFNLYSSNLIIQSGKQMQIQIADFADQPINAQVVKQTLQITEHKAMPKNHLFSLSWSNAASYIKITIPDSATLTSISGRNNGNLILQNLQLQDITIDSREGDILLNNINLKHELRINAKEGDLVISQTQINTAALKLSEGDASLNRSIFKQAAVQANEGNVEITQCNATLQLGLKEGDIEIVQSQLRGENLIRTKEGDLSLRQLVHDLTFKLDTKDGDIVYHNSSIGHYFDSMSEQNDRLEARLREGDIIIY